MIANLPLLFTGGHPVALSHATAAELERFITFMVTCSWGHDTAASAGDIRRPLWWPPDVPFQHPFVRPASAPPAWEARLKNLVRKCYDHHKSAFLLVFSAQLARYPRARLRYVDNLDDTTSLYLKPNGRLLVTFRNENMYYDRNQPVIRNEPIVLDEQTDLDEPIVVLEDLPIKSANIYLCDNCDSHFDNIEILSAHERLCNNETVPTERCEGRLPDFLSALKLQPLGLKFHTPESGSSSSDIKLKSARSAANIDRGPPFPFSSLAYTKLIKNHIQRDTTYSRERVERYCCTSNLPNKPVVNKLKNQHFPVRYRRPIDYWHRKHVFPNQRHKKILDLNAQLLYLKCGRITVDVERMSVKSMQEYIEQSRKESETKRKNMEDKDIIFVDCTEEAKCSETEGKESEDCEVIDLCSDDETPVVNENCDPRAGVTCIMRGGAILRRTAATPHALPSEPCGARQRPLPSAVLQPHPVLLITHSLNNLQTISLE